MTDDTEQEPIIDLVLNKLLGFRHLTKLDDAERGLRERAEAIFNKIGNNEPGLG
jgi:hypothetical protein